MSQGDDVGFLYKTMIERDPKKRRVKPIDSANQAALLEFDLEESSDDSDFRIEDHYEDSDDDSLDSVGLRKDHNDQCHESDDDNSETSDGPNENNVEDGDNDDDDEENDDDDDDDDDDGEDDDDDDDEDDDEEFGNITDNNINHCNKAPSLKNDTKKCMKENETNGKEANATDFHEIKKKKTVDSELNKLMICCGCLGERSDDVNEIIECDSCGVTVHEGCYGVSDVESFSSADSLSQSAPWFCDACSAGVDDPSCELCPNKGGIFKETDVGKWVHLVCALYIPGVAFGEVDRLASVTLFEIPYNKWGSKACSLCEDLRYSRTGICIECDAGMCHTYFHVTCAQREGLLSEAHTEEVDQADPFYAHCNLHSDKALVRRRRRNWMTIMMRELSCKQIKQTAEYRNSEDYQRIQRKLAKHRKKYLAHKISKPPPWVPNRKIPRLLTTSASVCRNLYRKAESLGINIKAMETQEEQMTSLVDIHKKWHIPPAFTVEFVSYYLDRHTRASLMNTRRKRMLETNCELLKMQQELDKKYDMILRQNETELQLHMNYKKKLETFSQILSKNSNYAKYFPNIASITNSSQPSKDHQVIKATPKIIVNNKKQKQDDFGSSLELENHNKSLGDKSTKVILQIRHQCGTCRRASNQHLLAKCDTCQLHYHLSCLNPPLSRMPKKTRLFGWQCSECDKEDSSSDAEAIDTSAPRKLRQYKDSKLIEEISQMQKDESMISLLKAHEGGNFSSDNSINGLDYSEDKKLKIRKINPKKSKDKKRKTEFQPSLTVDEISPVKIDNSIYRMAHSDDSIKHSTNRFGKKRRREKHKRYTPDLICGVKQRKRKHKRRSLDLENQEESNSPNARRITIKIKPIPLPEEKPECRPPIADATSSFSEMSQSKFSGNNLYSNQSTYQFSSSPLIRKTSLEDSITSTSTMSPSNLLSSPKGIKKPKIEIPTAFCVVCNLHGTNQNSVECDECTRSYHFSCLDPPVKKSPKRRGYSWHCADCDPSESDVEQ